VEQLVVNAVGIAGHAGTPLRCYCCRTRDRGRKHPSAVMTESPPARPVDPQGSAQSRVAGRPRPLQSGSGRSTLRLSMAVLAGVLWPMLGVVLVRRARPPPPRRPNSSRGFDRQHRSGDARCVNGCAKEHRWGASDTTQARQAALLLYGLRSKDREESHGRLSPAEVLRLHPLLRSVELAIPRLAREAFEQCLA